MGESWRNWSGSVQCDVARLARPRSEDELAAVVREAGRNNRHVRVVGSGHSFSPVCATDGVLISLDDWAGIESTDTKTKRATVRAGTKICQLGAPLLEAGLALANQGDVDVQSVGGALGTGTHGTGPGLAHMSSRIHALRTIDAEGELVEWNAEDHPDELAAARVSLGAFGVVSAVTLDCVPAYRLHERMWRVDLETCLAQLDSRIAATRHFEFFWYPGLDRCEMKSLASTDAEPSPMADVEGEYVDWSWRVFPSEREIAFNEMEISVPASAAVDCFCEIRERMRTKWPDVVWPVEYRTLGADGAWLSQAYERDSVTISIHEDARAPCDPLFGDLEQIFAAYDGRPHWGKRSSRTRRELEPLYPRWADFCRLREEVDPEGRFLNPYLADLFR